MRQALAMQGGAPVRTTLLPYARQYVDDQDIKSVVEVLRGAWLTTGPRVAEFEAAFADFVGAREAVAVSSGTAALHAAMYALDIRTGDEVIVPPMTFAATANAVVFQGGRPVFADVDPHTLLLDPAAVESQTTPRTRAIIAVDYAGQPCDYDSLRDIADRYHLALVADACHALGAGIGQPRRPVGSVADLSTFSFHPVKHLTTGEGGMITTNDPELAQRMRRFRHHGISHDHHQRAQQGSWYYDMIDLGYNYRLSDLHCALGLSQLPKVPGWVVRRQEIAQQYDAAFAEPDRIQPLARRPDVYHAYHLYVIRLHLEQIRATRTQVFAALRAEGIGVNVHYIPVHLHPFYRRHFGTRPGLCPVAEAAYEQILSLPIFPLMTDSDAEDVVHAVDKVCSAYRHRLVQPGASLPSDPQHASGQPGTDPRSAAWPSAAAKTPPRTAVTPQLQVWQGNFCRAYTDRNRVDWHTRLPAFRQMLEGLPIHRVLEVGCNRGHNLLALLELLGDEGEVVGLEPNRYARELARSASVKASVVNGHAFDLPFKDAYFDLVFTAGVLIHIALPDLPAALEEIYRVSRRYILALEYFAVEETAIHYRGHDDLLWKRDFLRQYRTRFPDLRPIRSGYWRFEDGFDRTHWWLLEKPCGSSGCTANRYTRRGV